MPEALDHLVYLMIFGAIGVFLLLASVIIFLLEEAGKILLHSLRDATIHAWEWISNHARALARIRSALHSPKP